MSPIALAWAQPVTGASVCVMHPSAPGLRLSVPVAGLRLKTWMLPRPALPAVPAVPGMGPAGVVTPPAVLVPAPAALVAARTSSSDIQRSWPKEMATSFCPIPRNPPIPITTAWTRPSRSSRTSSMSPIFWLSDP